MAAIYSRRNRLSIRLCKLVAVLVFGSLYLIVSNTKHTSLRLTSFDMELQGLKTTSEHNTSSDISRNNNNKDCFWYTDNLYHLMCAVLTGRPVQFHTLFNRIPRMHRELFRLLNVEKCTSSSFRDKANRGAGATDLDKHRSIVQSKLQQLQISCQKERNPNDNTPKTKKPKKKCLHLARNFNRRLQNCTEPLNQCDMIKFDDTLSFCHLWNVVQEYPIIVSPHGFQLVLPILAHSALMRSEVGNLNNSTTTTKTLLQQQPHTARIVEIRWPGYGDKSYQQLTQIFSMNHTLLYGMTPNGKLNQADNDCVKHQECRKAERKRDLFCTAKTQRELNDIISSSLDQPFGD